MDDVTDKCQLYIYDKDNFSLIQNNEAYFADIFHVEDMNNDKVYWLNYHDISNKSQIEELSENLLIDKLSVEDIYTEKIRAKLEEYPNYIFFSVRSILPHQTGKNKLKQEQISFVLGESYLISFQEQSSDHFTTVRDRITQKKGKIREKGADFLLYRMLDAIVDNYFELLEDIVLQIESLDRNFQSRHMDRNILHQIETQRRRLTELRKIVNPLDDISIRLEHINHTCIEQNNKHYFRDLRENCLSIMDEIEINKHLLEGLTNLYYAVQGQKLNDIIRVLTVVSTIFIPLTFVVGVYGMNFKYMPELEMRNGYFITMIGMSLIALFMLIFFIRRGWLKRK